MAKARVIAFKPRLVDCDKETRELLEALLEKCVGGDVAGLLVVYEMKNGQDGVCVTGAMSDTDKAIGAGTRAIARLGDA